MASIKGIEVKNLKSFRGVEYPTNYQGNVFYNGKKMGFWSQDSWGGPDRYEFDSRELDAVAKEYYGEDSIYDLDCLMGELLELVDYEKNFKKAVKEGYTALVVITNGYLETQIKIPQLTDKDAIRKDCESDLKAFEKRAKSKKDIQMMIFTNLADFAQ